MYVTIKKIIVDKYILILLYILALQEELISKEKTPLFEMVQGKK